MLGQDKQERKISEIIDNLISKIKNKFAEEN